MCGIVGILNWKKEPDNNLTHRMLETIKHRGSDDYGVFSSRDKHLHMGHCRLSILDLSTAGHQPMVSRNRKTLLTYNGEIYNYKDLRNRFFPNDDSFSSTGDTELLLRLWEKLGPDCLSLLRGMFAFAVWDEETQELILARDSLGIKPLYYYPTRNGFTFASELKALKVYEPGLEPNPMGVKLFLELGSIPDPQTIYAGVRALEAGSYIKISSSGSKVFNYWNYHKVLDQASRDRNPFQNRNEAVEYIREELLDSVRAHLISDVPVGVFLSGGIDSSSLVALMRDLGHQKIKTFSISFGSSKIDESSYAEQIANVFHTEHQNLEFREDDFFNIKEHFLESMDQPSVDGLNTFFVSRLAHQAHQKVVLSGIGGDEIFGGYSRDFIQMPKLQSRLRYAGWPPRMLARAGVNAGLKLGLLPPKWRRVAEFLSRKPSLLNCLLARRSLFSPSEIASFFRSQDFLLSASTAGGLEFLPEISERMSTHDAVSCYLLDRYLKPQLLRDSDTNSMAFTLELRTPLVDAKLYEAVAKIQNKDWHYQNGMPKALLVDAVGNLPRAVTHRTKQGFFLPMDSWLKKEKHELQSEYLDQSAYDKLHAQFMSGKVHWTRLWALIVLDRMLAR